MFKMNHSGVCVFCLIALIVLITSGCQDMLPSAYQDETVKASESDSRACEFFGADSGLVVRAALFSSKKLDSLWIQADDTLLDSTYNQLLEETVYLFDNQELEDTLYVLYYPQADSEAYTNVYITFELNDVTSDAFIDLDILKKDGSKVGPVMNDMAPEALAYCTQKAVISGQDVYLPSLRAKYQVLLDPELLLLRFVLSDAPGLDTFRVILLP